MFYKYLKDENADPFIIGGGGGGGGEGENKRFEFWIIF